jgi:hypothetical protein
MTVATAISDEVVPIMRLVATIAISPFEQRRNLFARTEGARMSDRRLGLIPLEAQCGAAR